MYSQVDVGALWTATYPLASCFLRAHISSALGTSLGQSEPISLDQSLSMGNSPGTWLAVLLTSNSSFISLHSSAYSVTHCFPSSLEHFTATTKQYDKD